eukprot:4748210-Pyramimonas_sp.AAC.1
MWRVGNLAGLWLNKGKTVLVFARESAEADICAMLLDVGSIFDCGRGLEGPVGLGRPLDRNILDVSGMPTVSVLGLFKIWFDTCRPRSVSSAMPWVFTPLPTILCALRTHDSRGSRVPPGVRSTSDMIRYADRVGIPVCVRKLKCASRA